MLIHATLADELSYLVDGKNTRLIKIRRYHA
jgi:hypothetical protein